MVSGTLKKHWANLTLIDTINGEMFRELEQQVAFMNGGQAKIMSVNFLFFFVCLCLLPLCANALQIRGSILLILVRGNLVHLGRTTSNEDRNRGWGRHLNSRRLYVLPGR